MPDHGAHKLTGERLEAFLNGLRLGMTRRAASSAVGIGKSTLYRMLEEDADGTLRDALEKAEGEAEARYTALVAKAAEGGKSWQAAAWWLERRRHDDFALRQKVDMTVDLRKVAEAVGDGLDPDAVMAEAERILNQ
jgi:transposase